MRNLRFINVIVFIGCFLTGVSAFGIPQSKRFAGTSDQYTRYANSMLKNYDKNKDDFLDSTEIGKMRRPPTNADSNKDGFLSKQELVAYYASRSNREPNQAERSKAPSPPNTASINIEFMKLGPGVDIDELEKQIRKLNRSKPMSDKNSIEGIGGLLGGGSGDALGGLIGKGDLGRVGGAIKRAGASTRDTDKVIDLIKHLAAAERTDTFTFQATSGHTCVFQNLINDPYKRHEFDFEMKVRPTVYAESVGIDLEITKTVPIDSALNLDLEATDNKAVDKSRLALSINDRNRILEALGDLQGKIKVRVSAENETLVLEGNKKDIVRIQKIVGGLFSAAEKASEERLQKRAEAQNAPVITRSLNFSNTLLCDFDHAVAMVFSESDQQWMLLVRASQ